MLFFLLLFQSFLTFISEVCFVPMASFWPLYFQFPQVFRLCTELNRGGSVGFHPLFVFVLFSIKSWFLRNSNNALYSVKMQTGVLFASPLMTAAGGLTHTGSLLTLSKRLCGRADSALRHTKRAHVAQVHKSLEPPQVWRQFTVRQHSNWPTCPPPTWTWWAG